MELWGLMMRTILRVILLSLMVSAALVNASAQSICPLRPSPGSPVLNPLDLYSQNGVLTVDLTLQNQKEDDGFMHYCYNYMYQGQVVEAPTFRLNPGDRLIVNLTDNIQSPYDRYKGDQKVMTMEHSHGMAPAHGAKAPDDPCLGQEVLPGSTNIHFHGMNISPICHEDDVINTIIQSGDPAFQYSFQIPANDPPGMFWYHPHVHGNTTTQVEGGAAGAIIIEGTLQGTQGLPERVMIIRQQFENPNSWIAGPNQLTLNFQPALYPGEPSPVVNVQYGQSEFWRVVNATTQAFLSLQIQFGTTAQQLQLLAIDGVPLTTPSYQTTLTVPPAGRVEFVMPGLPSGQTGTFLTTGFNTGPVGNPNPLQALASIVGSSTAKVPPPAAPPHPVKPPTEPQRFAGLASQNPTAKRSLYFSEQTIGTNGPTQFFITVKGQTPKVFTMDEPPSIVTNTGTVEDWTIENHTGETHAFHIHQIHFLVMAINGVPVPNPDLQDTIVVPNWGGTGPFPSVTLRMDFRDPNIAGTFVYHCHILDHEDAGMMEKIQVNPAN
jgi:FtsP/CotA-like multicopper oxidase with cupredoxin domain